MTTTVAWEAVLADGPDGYGQWAYAAPVDLTCWTEPHGIGVNSGQTAVRKPDGTVVDPDWDYYFDGDDPLARQIKLWDRFTPGGIGNEGKKLQALVVETMYGPPFDNTNPWLVVVSL